MIKNRMIPPGVNYYYPRAESQYTVNEQDDHFPTWEHINLFSSEKRGWFLSIRNGQKILHNITEIPVFRSSLRLRLGLFSSNTSTLPWELSSSLSEISHQFTRPPGVFRAPTCHVLPQHPAPGQMRMYIKHIETHSMEVLHRSSSS